MLIVQMTFYFPKDNIQVRLTCILSCFLILATVLSGSGGDKVASTSYLTWIQLWRVFAVFFTFCEICLQTLIGFLKHQGKNEARSINKVNDGHTLIMKTEAVTYEQTGYQINFWFGKVASPVVFVLFTATYFVMASQKQLFY